jgi:CubicO group peptidase (beta-lactamase class C family)
MSTVQDAVRFVTHLRNNSILSEQEKEIVWSPTHPEINPYYGLGFELNFKNDKLESVGHTGAQDKARTIMRYYFEADIGISLMSNSENFDSTACLNGLMNIILSDSTE